MAKGLKNYHRSYCANYCEIGLPATRKGAMHPVDTLSTLIQIPTQSTELNNLNTKFKPG